MVFFELNRTLIALRRRDPDALFRFFNSMGFDLYWIRSPRRLRRVRSYRDVLTSSTNVLAVARLPDYLSSYVER
jgi:Uma2 family endonuclease